MEDSAIIELYFSRSENAIAETAAKYGRLCSKIAASILRNQQDSEECVNSAYMRLWGAIPPKQPNPFCAYLCKIVRNLAINTYNREKRRETDALYSELCEIIPDGKDTESSADSKEISRYINSFLDSSDKKSRVIFVSRYFFNYSISDIAKSVGMSENAVKSRLCRTREKLKSYLCERGVDL